MNQAEFYEYEDAVMRMRLPIYLRPKKGMRFFGPHHRKGKDQVIYTIAVELGDSRLAEVYGALAQNDAGDSMEWMGVRSDVIRRGPSKVTDNGVEVLVR